jgi:hypothetical protein
VNAFQEPGQPRWVFHVLNYNVPLGSANRPPETQGPLEFHLPISPRSQGKQTWKLVCYDPNGTTSELSAGRDGGSLCFTLPEVRVHKIIELRNCETSKP